MKEPILQPAGEALGALMGVLEDGNFIYFILHSLLGALTPCCIA